MNPLSYIIIFILTPRIVALVSQSTCNGKRYTYLELTGFGTIPSDARDFLGDTQGGTSSIALDRSQWKKVADGSYTGVLWALPDRGWNSNGTVNYWSRIHQFSIHFTPQQNATAANPSGPNLLFTYLNTILLYGPDGVMPCTGLDADPTGHLSYKGFPNMPVVTYPGDVFGGPPAGTKAIPLDAEGLVLNADGSFWISDEYGPYIYRFDETGKMIAAIRPPDAFIPRRNGSESFSSDSPARGSGLVHDVFPADNPTGRHNNRGFEGLTVSSDGKTLWALLQSSLNQEGGLSRSTERYVRLLQYDITAPRSPRYAREYVVPLPLYTDSSDGKTKVAAQSEILHVQKGQLFVLSRDADTDHLVPDFKSTYRHVDIFDIDSATDIKGDTYDCATCAIASSGGKLKSRIQPATYCSFLDFNVKSELSRFGLTSGADSYVAGLLSAKWESLAVAPVDGRNGDDDEWFLFAFNDNEFITQNGFVEFGQVTYKDPSGVDLSPQALVFKIKVPDHSHAFI